MGAVASVVQALSCQSCAKYVCNNLSARSQCCDEEDVCNCTLETHETHIESADEHHLDISLPWANIHAGT